MSPDAEEGTEGSVYRYVMLVFILALLLDTIKTNLTTDPAYRLNFFDNYTGILMLLFMHLSFAFKWPKVVARVLWILVWVWLVFFLFHTIFLL
jgi:hypothetical protein